MLLAILITCVAWLTASATAVRSVSRIWLRHWAERRLHGSGAADIYLDRPQRLLSPYARTLFVPFRTFETAIARTVLRAQDCFSHKLPESTTDAETERLYGGRRH
jgi:hypothetical protein